MIFRKKRKDILSEVFKNGGISTTPDSTVTGPGGDSRQVDPLELLRNSCINTDLIPEDLLPTIASSNTMNTEVSSEIAKIKVDCATCNRPVAYGKGKCMYCGKPLKLPESAQAAMQAAGGSAATTALDFDLGDSL